MDESTAAIMGRVARDMRVVSATPSAARTESFFSVAAMGETATAAGNAAPKIMAILMGSAMGSQFTRRKVITGDRIIFKTDSRMRTLFLKILQKLLLPSWTPITIMARGVVASPMSSTGVKIKSGIAMPVNRTISPRMAAMVLGPVMALIRLPFPP